MNVTVTCDRCKKQVDGISEGKYTAGYYCVENGDEWAQSYWSRFTNSGEKIICDACMWADPRYIAVYGVMNANQETTILGQGA